jgi:hypothetical protein
MCAAWLYTAHAALMGLLKQMTAFRPVFGLDCLSPRTCYLLLRVEQLNLISPRICHFKFHYGSALIIRLLSVETWPKGEKAGLVTATRTNLLYAETESLVGASTLSPLWLRRVTH